MDFVYWKNPQMSGGALAGGEAPRAARRAREGRIRGCGISGCGLVRVAHEQRRKWCQTAGALQGRLRSRSRLLCLRPLLTRAHARTRTRRRLVRAHESKGILVPRAGRCSHPLSRCVRVYVCVYTCMRASFVLFLALWLSPP